MPKYCLFLAVSFVLHVNNNVGPVNIESFPCGIFNLLALIPKNIDLFIKIILKKNLENFLRIFTFKTKKNNNTPKILPC